MDTGDNSTSKSIRDMPILVCNDSRETSEEKTITNAVTVQRKGDSVPANSEETHVRNLLTESEAAISDVKNKNLSESEVALRNLESKLKEVQTKLNLNTTESSSTSESVAKKMKEDKTEKESEANVQGKSGTEKLKHESSTPKALKLNIESAKQNQHKDGSGNVTTPQKQVAEAWKSVGLQRCRFCKFSTDNDSLFKQHTVTCTPKVSLLYNGRIYICETCDLTWTVKGEFEEHIVCHTTDQPYVCINCRKVFESRLLTEQHEKSEHPDGNSYYGLRGMKKARKLVEELERIGKFQFRGKIDIPPTLRNKEVTGIKSVVTSNKKSDEVLITGEEASRPVVSASQTTAAQSQINATPAIAATVSSVLGPVVSNSALIEQKMEKVRQYVISSRGGGILESKEKFSGNQDASTNDSQGGTKVVKEEPKDSRPKAHILTQPASETKDKTPVAQVMIQTSSTPVSNTGVTVQYQPNSKSASLIVTKPPDTLPNTIILSSVSQPILNQIYNPSTNILNISGPPNATVTPSQKINYNPRHGQTSAQQPPREYQFQEYVYPPPPRPRIPVASVAPSPVVQTSVKAKTSVRASPTQVPPAAVQTNSFVFLPVDFNAPNATSNILIPVAPVNQSAQQAGQSALSYPVVTLVQPSNQNPVNYRIPSPVTQTSQNVQPTLRYPVAASTSKQPASQVVQTKVTYPGPMFDHMVRYPVHIASQQTNSGVNHTASKPTVQQGLLTSSVGSSSATVTANSIPASKPQLVFTSNSIAPLSQTSQEQNLGNAGAKIPAADTAIISTTSKHHVGGVPTVEISVLPEKPQEKVSQGVKTDSNSQQYNLSKRYLFRIKPGHGFVCEACRKFTQDEVIFRRHVWDHFHTVTRSCKFCTPDHVRRKDFMNCKLVSNVVCSLVKKSANQNKALSEENGSQKTISVVDDEVIAISDDEEESKKTNTYTDDEQEIIVVDEDDPPQKQTSETTTGILPDDTKLEKQKINLRKEIAEDLKRENSKNEFDKYVKGKLTSTKLKQDKPKIDECNQKEEITKTEIFDLKDEKAKLLGTVEKEVDDTEKDSKKSIKEYVKKREETHSDKFVNKGSAEEITCKSAENDKTALDKESVEKSGTEAQAQDRSNSAEQAHSESERNQSEKLKTTKLLHASKVASKRFERGLLSSRKSSAFYMCGFDQCSFTSLTSQKYKEHLTSNHAGAYSYICCHCGLKSFTDDAHIRHINSHANTKTFLLFNCPFNPCRYKTNLIHMFCDHVKSHKEIGIKCTYCHKAFETAENLVDHLRANLVKYVSCPHCHFKFQLKDTVAKHITLAHPDKQRIVTVSSQIVCLERELNFYNAPLAKTMPNDKRNSLDSIGLPLTQHEVDATTFLNAGETNDKKGTENIQTIPIDEDKLSDRISASPQPPVLIPVTPEKNKESQSDKPNAEAPRSLVCTKCNFISWNYKLHLQHLSLHETDEPEREKRFVCIYCPKGFDGLNPFKTHISNHVGKHQLKIYGCTICVFTTSQKYHIIDHCKDNHSGTGTYFEKTELVVSKEASCRYCAFKSRKAEDVHLHEKAIHLNQLKGKNKDEKAKTQIDKDENKDDQVNTQIDEINSLQQTGKSVTTTESTATSECSDHSQKLRKYHCHYCMNYFKHKADLKEHMQTSHVDIESKSFVTFKCKYCHFTSTMKNLIINHIERKHVNEAVRILRRIENIDGEKASDETEKATKRKEEKTIYRCGICDYTNESSEKFKRHFADKHANDDSDDKESETGEKEGKEKIYIPDGNTFKDPIQCPKCSYSNKLRVNILRHIKEHPELAPTRNPVKGDQSPTKMTARKSTSKSSISYEETKLKNPFAAVKDAVRELDRTDKDHSKTIEKLALGGEFLHEKLADCYEPLEKEFKCKICRQKIIKKFVLHKHILNHLRVVFFKCHYCNKGDIEQSLLSGHIQQQHSLKPIKFAYMDISEVCSEIKEKVKKYNFNVDTPLDVQEISDNSENSDDVSLGFGIIRKQIREADMKGDDEPEESVFKCSRCDYFTKREENLLRHRKSHMNPDEKKYGCSICAYRAMVKVQVMKHMKKIHPKQPMKYKVFGNNSEKTVSETEEKKDSVEQDKLRTTDKAKMEEDSKETSKMESKVSETMDNNAVSDAGTFEIKSVYKCKECGEKRNSKWAMYYHFKTSKCNKQWYQCDACAFTNQYKKAITQHAKIRHPGRKVGIIELPLSHKIRHIKVPVKQDEQMLKSVQVAVNTESSPKNGDETEKQEKPVDNGKSEIHECQICSSYKSESLSKIQYHMNTKHQGKPLHCVECDYKTPLIKHIINHCLDVHKLDKAKYSTKVQDKKESKKKVKEDHKTDTSVESKHTHATTLKKYKCPNCDISKDSPKMLREHMQIHFDYKPYVCKYCSAKYQHFSNVRRHVNNAHNGKTVKYSMVKDEKVEKRLDDLLDKVCKQREKENSKMINTTVQMIKKKPEKRNFESDEEILPPKKKKRAIIETDDNTSQDESEDESSAIRYRVIREPGTNAKLFQCWKCDYKTPKKESLHGHLGKHAVRKNQGYTYKCAYCDYTTLYHMGDICKHIRAKHKGKPEKVLNMKGQDVTERKRRRVMDSERSDESSSDESVASEQATKKMVTLKYFCNVCDFRITGLYHFRQHLAIHKEFTRLQKGSDIESRLSCGYCSYMATDDTDFSVHIANHLDERPFQCGYCEYSGYMKCVLQKHHASVHPGKEEMIFESAGERIKGKQTMLVDFDPQIKLENIDKSVLSGNKTRQGTWKIEHEEIVEQIMAVAASDQVMTEEAPMPQKKIENLFSLQSKEQKKSLPASDLKLSSSSANIGSVSTLSVNVNPISSFPESETAANTKAQIDGESENENMITDGTEDRSGFLTSSPLLKTIISENRNNTSAENSSKAMPASQLLKTIANEIENCNNNNDENNSKVMLPLQQLQSGPKENKNQKNEKSEIGGEKRHSSNCKTVSVKIPSPVKSGETKTVRLQIPSPMKNSKLVDKSPQEQGTDDIDMDLPMFTGNTLVYREETSQTELNMPVDNNGEDDPDNKPKLDKQISIKAVKENSDILEQEKKKDSDKDQPRHSRNGEEKKKIISVKKDTLYCDAEKDNVGESDKNNELESQKLKMSIDVSEGDTSVILNEKQVRLPAISPVDDESEFLGNVLSNNCLKNEDNSHKENITEQMETESIEGLKTGNTGEKQIEVYDFQTCDYQENGSSKEFENHNRDSNQGVEQELSKTSILQDEVIHIEERKVNESDKGLGTTNNASQGFEVFDESEALVEPEIDEHSNDEIQNVGQISGSQPFDYGGEINKESDQTPNEEIDHTMENSCGKKDEKYFGTDLIDNEKRDESGIETLRCHQDDPSVSKFVAEELDLTDISNIVPSRHDTVDGDHEKMNFATSDYKDNSSDSDSIVKQTKDSMLEQDKSDVHEIERTDHCFDPVIPQTTSISNNAENNAEESHDDILSKIDSVLFESKDSDKIQSELNVGDKEFDLKDQQSEPTVNDGKSGIESDGSK